MTTTRILRTAPATLTHTFYVGETPTDATGAVAVAVTDAGGTAVASGNAVHAGAGTGRYTFALPGQAQLSQLNVAWTATIAGSTVAETDQVEVVGGFLFTLVEGRGSDKTLSDQVKYPTDDLIEARQEVEEELERITQRAFVPRYRRLVLAGSGTRDLVVPDGGDDYVAGILLRGVRLPIRSASVASAPGQAAVPFTSGQLQALSVAGGALRRGDGGVWTAGGVVVLEYEYGCDAPPADLKKAALLRFRSRLNLNKSGVPERAISFTVAEGGTYRLSTPSAERTGLPEVDAVYARYSRGAAGPGGGPAPASRTLDYNPQRDSLFHGGYR